MNKDSNELIFIKYCVLFTVPDILTALLISRYFLERSFRWILEVQTLQNYMCGFSSGFTDNWGFNPESILLIGYSTKDTRERQMKSSEDPGKHDALNENLLSYLDTASNELSMLIKSNFSNDWS